MGLCTRETGKMDMQLVKENFTTLMEIFMKDNGIITKPMDMVSIPTRKELDMRASGEMTNSTGKG